ncbi:MAG: penicillin-binding protein activator LpoB [Gammaproteobacteria bacterium]
MKKLRYFLIMMISVLLVSCATTTITGSQKIPLVHVGVNWGVIPMVNNTQTPQAGEKAATITAGILRATNIRKVIIYKQRVSCSKILACPQQQPSMYKVRTWARMNHIRYVMMGTVNEWRYKVGLDGEPAVSVDLNLIDMRTGKIIWNAVGSKVGGSRGSLGVIAHQLIAEMLYNLITVNNCIN